MSTAVQELETTSVALPADSIIGSVVRMIPLRRLIESPNNPRKIYPEKEMEELTESMRASGFQAWKPLIVRPLPDDVFRPVALKDEPELFEIGGGHRRRQAAERAGIDFVPCIVSPMTDEQFWDVLNFDNSQREGVHPLHESAGWVAYLAKTGKKVADIAARIGKSEEYVYQRLKYADLCCEGKQAFLDNKISPGHAILIARLLPDQQLEALEFAIPPDWDDPEDRPSVRMLAAWIQRTFRAAESRQASSAAPSESASSPATVENRAPEPVEMTCSVAVFKELRESISCDIIPQGKVRKPVQFDADTVPYVGVGGISGGSGPESVECYEIYKISEFDEDSTTYKARCDEGDAGRNHPKGFYHGVRVKRGGQSYVLCGPPVVFISQGEPKAQKPYGPPATPAAPQESADVKARIECELKVRLAIVNAIRRKITLGRQLAKWEIGDLIAMILVEPISRSGTEELCRIHGIAFDDAAAGEPFTALRNRLVSLSHEEMTRLAIEITVVNDLDSAAISRNDPARKLMEVARGCGLDAVKIRREIESAAKNKSGGAQREVGKVPPLGKPETIGNRAKPKKKAIVKRPSASKPAKAKKKPAKAAKAKKK